MRQGLLALFILCPAIMFGQMNSPYKSGEHANVRYGAFVSQPKTLDPAKAYSADAYNFIAQIYEPPLQYSYFKRPYELVPLTTTEQVKPIFYDHSGHVVDGSEHEKVAYTIYDIKIKPNLQFENHPAFAKHDNGEVVYQTAGDIPWDDVYALRDFKHTGTRQLVAADYVYQIKRLASPKVGSKISYLMQEHIDGLKEYAELMQTLCPSDKCSHDTYLDLNQHDIEGVKIINDHHFQIKIKGVYRQFKYWLAMPFFAPIPHEVDQFYSIPGMKKRNFSFDWYPVGTGPYYLEVNDPNKEMVLTRNPNFREEYFPSNGSANDKAKGYMQHAGKKLPLVDKFIYSLDKESIPRWNKFLQGYYDASGIGGDVFDQAVSLDASGKPVLTDEMKNKGVRLQTMKAAGIYYMGFNINDPVVGGKNKFLRQAISIAIDYHEYISLFLNGRGEVAQGPIPPGIFGYHAKNNQFNSVLFHKNKDRLVKKSIDAAKSLMEKAGYVNGIDPKTGRRLKLYFDTVSAGNDSVYRYKWFRKQLNKIGIDLRERATDYNTFQDKVKSGNVQIFESGWNLDYPDPENFLFLLYSKNGKVKYKGVNWSNYNNKVVDKLFVEIKNMPNGSVADNIARRDKINELIKVVQDDAPWIWGFYPISYTLTHDWNSPVKLSDANNNVKKYSHVDSRLRAKKLHEWNKPLLWPIIILCSSLLLLLIIGCFVYYRNDRRSSTKRMD